MCHVYTSPYVPGGAVETLGTARGGAAPRLGLSQGRASPRLLAAAFQTPSPGELQICPVMSIDLSGRPKKLTLKGYKPYWCTFKDTSISCYKSKEEANGTPAHQMNLRGKSSVRTLPRYSSSRLPLLHLGFPLVCVTFMPSEGWINTCEGRKGLIAWYKLRYLESMWSMVPSESATSSSVARLLGIPH